MIGVVPSILSRSSGLVELSIRNTEATHYRISAHNTLNGAHTGATALFTVQKGGSFRSATLRQKGLGLNMDSNRGLTRIAFDISDFNDAGGGAAGPTVPLDEQIIYLRVEESMDEGATWLDPGPTLVIPPPEFYRSPNPALVLSGTAPDIAATIGQPIPAGALHIVFPKFTMDITVRNHGTTGAAAGDMWYSIGHHHPAGRIEADDWWFGAASYREILLSGNGAAADFSINLGVASVK